MRAWWLLACLATSSALAGVADLRYVPPTKNTDGSTLTDLVSYRAWWGCAASGVYPFMQTFPAPASQFQVQGLPDTGTCYFVIAAINSAGRGAYSNQAIKMFGTGVVPANPTVAPTITFMEGGQVAEVFRAPLTTNLTLTIGAATPTFTRASAASYVDANGIVQYVTSGNPRIRSDLGLLMEEARTNSVLWSADLSNAAWVKTNVTIDATSTVAPDGNSLTVVEARATAANGTVLQTVTVGSAAYTYSVWLKRVTGSGNIDITIDGGSTWTTASVTGSWVLFSRTQTLANPNFGIRIVTSGDEVAMTFSQLEAGSFPTSYIATTTASVARSADQLSYGTNAFVSDSQGYAYVETTPIRSGNPPAPQAYISLQVSGSVSLLYNNAGSPVWTYDGTTVSTSTMTNLIGVTDRIGVRWVTAGDLQVAANGTVDATPASYDGAHPRDSGNFRVGSAGTVAHANSWIKNVSIGDADPGSAGLAALTTYGLNSLMVRRENMGAIAVMRAANF